MKTEKSVLIRVNLRPNLWLWAILILSVVFRIAIAAYYGDIVDAPALLTDQRSYHWLGTID